MDQTSDPNTVIDPLDDFPVLEDKVEETFEEIEHFGENNPLPQPKIELPEVKPSLKLPPLPPLPPLPVKG